MKRFISAAIIILAYSSAAFADPAEGYWLSVDHKTGQVESGWEIYQHDGNLLGKILSGLGTSASDIATRCRESYANFPVSGRVNQMPVLGTPWIFGLIRESPGRWVNGHVINPADGGIYRCTLIFHPVDGKKFMHETLEVRGQLLFFSGSQYWRRATREEASALR
ncbi:MAG: DUF2147 domain-containing protein [Treponema sp.]|jgi:uncharacterized protein (DUF2147 family)|nr:DUF2147 domain-containing protein [Treponema sp.]